MRHIGTIPDEERAIRFSDYLLARGIPNMVEESTSGDWAVWVEHDDQLDQGRAELEAFSQNPADPRYASAGKQAEKIRKDEQEREKRWRRRFVDVRTSWGQPRQWAMPVTMGLIILSVIVSFVTRLGAQMEPVGTALQIASWSGADGRLFEKVRETGQVQSEEELARWNQMQRTGPTLTQIRHGQVWRLVTPIFLHFHILHLLFNMFWLRDLGAMIESQRGSLFMLILVLVTAVAGNLGQYFSVPGYGAFMFGGMSGVVYALFGFVWMRSRYAPHEGLVISPQSVIIMLAWLVLGPLLMSNIGQGAHVVGFVSGLLIGVGPIIVRRIRRDLTRR